jgi:hypothetical protein
MIILTEKNWFLLSTNFKLLNKTKENLVNNYFLCFFFKFMLRTSIVIIRPEPQKVATSLLKTVLPSETAETFILNVNFRFISCTKFLKL